MATVPIHSRICALLIGLMALTGHAREVAIPHQGLLLNADLTLAAGRPMTDGVILMVHGGLAHRGMETMTQLQTLLNSRGLNTLAINLSLGINQRKGMYDCAIPHRHRQDDALDEIAAWSKWLDDQGARQQVLLGHSRGGAQAARYVAQGMTPQPAAMVLLAPATADNTDAASYQRRYGAPLAPVLARARSLVNVGAGETALAPVNLMHCRNTTASAQSMLSYYAEPSRFDTPSLLADVRMPTLVVVAGDDEVVIDLAAKLEPLVDGRRLQMQVVDGGDHLFRDLNAEDAADAIEDFLHVLRMPCATPDRPCPIQHF